MRETGLEPERFTEHYNGDAKEELQKDFELFESLGIFSLPAYLIEYEDKSLLVNRLIGYDTFVQLIDRISDGKVKPAAPHSSLEAFLKKHPLISLIELDTAFDTNDITEQLKSIDGITIDKEFIRYEKII